MINLEIFQKVKQISLKIKFKMKSLLQKIIKINYIKKTKNHSK